MRHQTDVLRPRKTAALVPAAVAGSIALLLSAPASPAAAFDDSVDAAERSGDHRVPRASGPVARAVQAPALRAPVAAVPATYTVKRGDTVWGIATRYGLRTADVLALNGLTASSIIQPGQVLRLIGTAAASPAAPATPAAPAARAYTVQNGDTLTSIARRHGVTVQALFSANSLGWRSIIYPGQKIAITGAPAVTPAAPAAPAPAPGPGAAPVSGATTYTVQKGDTLSGIAAAHGITVQKLFALNGLGWASIIYPDQKLVVKAPPAPASAAPAQAPVPSLDAEQTANIQLIIRIGRELGVPERGIAIAIGAAMQESSLHNLAYGDRDSKGLFQQRPSAGWGTEAQARDVDRATRAFYGGPKDPNGTTTRGLLDIPGWQSMTFTQAAQAVQISAYPDHYAKWELAASTWLAAFG